MTASDDLWDLFVGDGLAVSTALASSIASMTPDVPDDDTRRLMDSLAYSAFSIASQAVLIGVTSIAHLALAVERVLDEVSGKTLNPALAIPVLASSTDALRQAFATLASPDRSGARLDGPELAQLEAARFELETLLPLPGGRASEAAGVSSGFDVPATALRKSGSRALAAPAAETAANADEKARNLRARPRRTVAPPPIAGTLWEPTVDSDMVELFLDEVDERLDDLGVKLLELEARPDDRDLVRDVFRDLHTVKGSSAMVNLGPMNRLSHRAEDLVGQVREGARAVDAPVIDVLLGALDGLRAMAEQARARAPISVNVDALVARLHDPEAAVALAAGLDGETEVAAAASPSTTQRIAERTVKQTIRVDFDKLDRLMNLVGELVLGRDGLHGSIDAIGALAGELGGGRDRRTLLGQQRRGLGRGEKIGEELGRIERVLSELTAELGASSERIAAVSGQLRDQVMKLRMIPVGGIFRKHHRTVRDISLSTGKAIRLVTAGEDTELDKLLVESLDEPLMHLIRNACDHGIERPDERRARGKDEEGILTLSARHQGNQVVVELGDDGAGIDPERIRARAIERGLLSPTEAAELDERAILDVIFRPGFSTAEVVSDLSGRGVGMDVVRQTITTRLKGTIDIDSEPGRGTTFTLRLPLTLAIMQVLLARAGGEVFAIPLDAIVRTTTRPIAEVQKVGTRDVITIRQRQVPLISLAEVLELAPTRAGVGDHIDIVLTEVGEELYGLVCDALLEKKEIVIKPLGELLEGTPCAAGATLLGDRPALILDVPAVIRRARRLPGSGSVHGERRAAEAPVKASRTAHVLVVEDSDVVRETLRRLLADAGYRVTVARDGQEGLALAESERFDLVSTDVMMPRLDGYELTRRLRAMPAYADVPIVMVTSRGERIDRVRGFDAGVDEYITKPHDRHLLLQTVNKLLGESP